MSQHDIRRSETFLSLTQSQDYQKEKCRELDHPNPITDDQDLFQADEVFAKYRCQECQSQ